MFGAEPSSKPPTPGSGSAFLPRRGFCRAFTPRHRLRFPSDKLLWLGSIFSGVIHDTIKQRLRAALLASASGKTALDTAAHLASELTEDGTWPDLPAPGQAPSAGTMGGQLDRVLLLAKVRHLTPGGVDGPLIRAFDWWLSRDPQTGGWHHDQLTVPRRVGEIALLCEEELSLGAWGKVVEILSRARWSYWDKTEGWKDWTGAPLLGIAYSVILRGCLEKMPALCDTAFRRAFRHVRWERSGEDFPLFGTQQEAPSPSVDSLSLAQDYARLITLAHGTPSQAPVESVRLFVSYLLDFLQWTIRQSGFEADAASASSEVPKHRSLAASIVQLSQLGNPPRRAELLALAERLQGQGKPLTGHRSFGRSRVTFHQRPAFYSSLRLRTSRFPRHDFAPASAPPVGGTIYYLRHGQEYAGMQDRWNLRQLPGLTAVQRDHAAPPLDGSETPRLLGCVSEGEFGVGAVEQADAGLHARKAWFFFDESVVCLEAGVQGPPVSQPVFTSINQCCFEGVAAAENAARERTPLQPGPAHDLTGTRRIEHGGFLYYFPTALSVAARIAPGPPDREPKNGAAEPVFSLWIDHGLKPAGARSSYLVLPLEPEAAGRERNQAEIGHVEWLANTPAVQAAGYRKAGLVGVVFWEPGVVELPRGGRVAANRSCLLLCREYPSGGVVLSIANLLTQPVTVHVEYGGRCVSFELPGGADAGRSLSRQL